MIAHPLYYERKKEAWLAGKQSLNQEFVETLGMIFEFSEEISGPRAAELMDMITHLLRCREVCEKHGLMREVLMVDGNVGEKR